MDCEQHDDAAENGTAAPAEGAGDAPLAFQHHGIQYDQVFDTDGFIPLDSDDDDEEMADDDHLDSDDEMPDDDDYLDSDEEMPDDDHLDYSDEDDDEEEMAAGDHQPPPSMPGFAPYALLPPRVHPTGMVADDEDGDEMADGHQPPPSAHEFAPYVLRAAVLPSGMLAYVIMPLDGSTLLGGGGEGGGGGGGWYSNGGFGAVPAHDAAVAGLKKREFRGAGKSQDAAGGGCRICFEEFEDGEEVSAMPCSGGHEFHTQCIAKWLGVSNACPLCRHQLPTAPVV